MPEGVRFCVFLSCAMRHQPTELERCSACGRETQVIDPNLLADAARDDPGEWDDDVEFPVVMTTLSVVPGRDIDRILGLVHGTGHPLGPTKLTTAKRGHSAFALARIDLARVASQLGAEAVVGVVMTTYTGGVGLVSQTVGVHLLGTAVTFTDDVNPR